MSKKNSRQLFTSFQLLKDSQETASTFNLKKAKLLAYFKQDERYKLYMGDEKVTWKKFVASDVLQPLKLSTADRLVKIYQTYMVRLGLKAQDIENVDSLVLLRLRKVVSPKNVQVWLKKARLMSREDMLREIRYGKTNKADCHHQTWNSRTVSRIVSICKRCGKRTVKQTGI